MPRIKSALQPFKPGTRDKRKIQDTFEIFDSSTWAGISGFKPKIPDWMKEESDDTKFDPEDFS